MNYTPPPQSPPFNDALYLALQPLAPQAQQDQVKLQQIRQKYGQPKPAQAPKAPPLQWMGDNHA